jgi:hypothetical protein
VQVVCRVHLLQHVKPVMLLWLATSKKVAALSCREFRKETSKKQSAKTAAAG